MKTFKGRIRSFEDHLLYLKFVHDSIVNYNLLPKCIIDAFNLNYLANEKHYHEDCLYNWILNDTMIDSLNDKIVSCLSDKESYCNNYIFCVEFILKKSEFLKEQALKHFLKKIDGINYEDIKSRVNDYLYNSKNLDVLTRVEFGRLFDKVSRHGNPLKEIIGWFKLSSEMVLMALDKRNFPITREAGIQLINAIIDEINDMNRLVSLDRIPGWKLNFDKIGKKIAQMSEPIGNDFNMIKKLISMVTEMPVISSGEISQRNKLLSHLGRLSVLPP